MNLLNLLPVSRKPILDRYYVLRSKWLGIKIHHIKKSDEEFHTHPWWGVSFILGWYYEEYDTEEGWNFNMDGSRIRKPKFLINIISPYRAHRVVTYRPIWTLFIHGPRVNENWRYGKEKAPWRGPDNGSL